EGSSPVPDHRDHGELRCRLENGRGKGRAVAEEASQQTSHVVAGRWRAIRLADLVHYVGRSERRLRRVRERDYGRDDEREVAASAPGCEARNRSMNSRKAAA